MYVNKDLVFIKPIADIVLYPPLSSTQPLPHLGQNTHHGSPSASNKTKHVQATCPGSYDVNCLCTVSQVDTFLEDLDSWLLLYLWHSLCSHLWCCWEYPRRGQPASDNDQYGKIYPRMQ